MSSVSKVARMPARAEDLAPWPAGRVTAPGDAVHATPPTAGTGRVRPPPWDHPIVRRCPAWNSM
ncbi:hypothetical protein [Saccharothrix sp. Mg75]|uniref:hypothetical protein n=1 Tax=Saccharothrix sp. Mg75 TaxID=3445357 RepID=UPI003EF036ED